jgi:hypothetical protein
MWLACATDEEIAEVIYNNPKKAETIRVQTLEFQNLEELPNFGKVTVLHQDADFAPPLYNVWTFAKKTNGHNAPTCELKTVRERRRKLPVDGSAIVV